MAVMSMGCNRESPNVSLFFTEVLSWPSVSMKFSSAAHVESTIKFLRSRRFENCCEKYTKRLFKVKKLQGGMVLFGSC